MYQFIFYFIYRAKLKADGAKQSRYSASLVVMIFIVVHLGLLYSIMRFICCYFWQISIARTNAEVTGGDILSYSVTAIVILILSFRYFNEEKIGAKLTKYQETERFYTFRNILKFILLFILPLLTAIFLENKSVEYC